ncbi:MAG TPA: histidine kinase [Thermoanaerobaculia bacterium]|nr:histidine kinase [Thermoanaerobaculia bacterium]
MTSTPITAIRPDYTPHARAERLIAAGRFVLAFSSLVAIYLEPSTPARFQRATYSLLVIYTAYALITAIIAWRSPVPSARWRLFSHALDLVLFSVFVYLTEGPASPFFLYFVFSLFCATLRFSRRGILATGIAAMAIYAAMALVASFDDPTFEISRVLIREAYLAVIAALLFYLGMYHQRLRGEMALLAAWPRELAGGVEDVLRGGLAHAASVVSANRVLLVWEESEEPWIYIAAWSGRDFSLQRLAPGTFELPDGPRNTSSFVRGIDEPILVFDPARSTTTEACHPERSEGPVRAGREQRATAPRPPRSLATLGMTCGFAIDSSIVVSLETQSLTMHFVIPNVKAATADDLALAHIAGRLLLATLEQYFFVQQVRQTASAEERLRISRELHDGIVQSLGGVGLQLQAIRAQFAHEPAAIERLSHVQQVVEHDQRELRAIVRELRPHDARAGRDILADELQRMHERYALEWGLEVDVETRADDDVPARLAHELSRIVNESLANAAKHGGATRAKISVTGRDGHLHVSVADNGRGFPFTGRYDLDALQRTGDGPRTLKERVIALKGSLVVESSPRGAIIEVAIPIHAETNR